MELDGNSRKPVQSTKDYPHVPDGAWKTTRPYGIDYKEDSSKQATHDLKVRLGGTPDDLIDSRGVWKENCVEKEDGLDTVLSYSAGSVKDSGRTGSGAWHVKGCFLVHSHEGTPRDPLRWGIVRGCQEYRRVEGMR